MHATCKCAVENCNLQGTSMEGLCTNKYYLEGGLAREQQNPPVTLSNSKHPMEPKNIIIVFGGSMGHKQ
jgi:hypothetical protein